MSIMNILELAGFHSNYGSNFIPSLENLDRKLVEQGHKTFYIFSNENLSEGFYEWEIPFSRKHTTKLCNFHAISFIKEISKFIRENDIDIVHAHFCSSLYVSLIKKLSPPNVVFYQQMHTCPYNNVKCRKATVKRIRNFFVFDKKITVVCISKAMMPLIEYMFPRNKVIARINCIDFSRLEKRQYNRNPDFRILLFGYNYSVKGVDIAIKAVLKAKETIDDLHLDIIMGDNLEANSQRIIQEFGGIPSCVSILQPTNNIKPFYQNHTVFLNASRSEGGSYAILEAYYSGALCVISDVPATKESKLPDAILFESENPDALADAFVKAYQIKDTYSNNVEYVENNFSIDSWSEKIIEMMELN